MSSMENKKLIRHFKASKKCNKCTNGRTDDDGRTVIHWLRAGEGSGSSLFLCTIFACSQTSRYLFVALHLKWLPSFVNTSARNYQALA